MQHDHVPAPRLYAVENIAKVIKIELIHFHMSDPAVSGAALGNGEHDIQDYRKDAAGHGGYRLGEQVRYRNQEQRERNQSEAHRNLHAAEVKIERDLELALAGARITQNQHRQAIHREAPDHSEGIQVREESHIAAADKYGENLQAYDDVDDAIASAVPRVRLPEPLCEDAVLGNTIQYTVGTDDRGVHRASENKGSYHHDEPMKNQTDNQGSLKAHGQAADEVFEVILPDTVWNDHYREEGHQRGEHQAVDENDQARFFQIF